MKRAKLAVAAVAVLAACLIVPFAGSAADPADVTCTGTFSGTARDLIVPAGSGCDVTGATIARDVIVQADAGGEFTDTTVGRDIVFGDNAGALILRSHIGHDIVAGGFESGADVFESTVGHDLIARGEDSGFDLNLTTVGHDLLLLGLAGGTHMGPSTIGHDFYASRPQTVQTSKARPNTPEGPVYIGHDFTIEGSPDLPFVFDGICDLHVANDLRVTGRTVNLGIGLGGQCAGNGAPANTIGRDLIVTGNTAASGFFGPSSLRVGGNHVGRDLVFSHNTAVPGGFLEVSGNTVTRDAICAANSPAVTVNTPNVAGRANTCG